MNTDENTHSITHSQVCAHTYARAQIHTQTKHTAYFQKTRIHMNTQDRPI